MKIGSTPRPARNYDDIFPAVLAAHFTNRPTGPPLDFIKFTSREDKTREDKSQVGISTYARRSLQSAS